MIHISCDRWQCYQIQYGCPLIGWCQLQYLQHVARLPVISTAHWFLQFNVILKGNVTVPFATFQLKIEVNFYKLLRKLLPTCRASPISIETVSTYFTLLLFNTRGYLINHHCECSTETTADLSGIRIRAESDVKSERSKSERETWLQ